MATPRDELERIVREVVAPLLKADGGEVYLVGVSGVRVHLHLRGRFAGCPGNTLVKRRVIEPALHAVAPDAELELSSGAIVPPGAQLLS